MSQAYAEATDREVELVEKAKGFFEVHTRESGAKVGRIHEVADPWVATLLIRQYDWALIDYTDRDAMSLWKMWDR
jgi:histidinol phosphatase-like PHP family hydrolase